MNNGSVTLTLVSEEGERFNVDYKITQMCGLLRDMFEDNDNYAEEVPLPNIPSKFLGDIIRYCEHYDFKKVATIPVPLPSNNLAKELADEWEVDFIAQYDLPAKIKMIEAANFLNINALFELACASVAAIFKGKNYENIKKDLGIEEEAYTPEEEDEMQQRFPWILNELVAVTKQKLNGQKPPTNNNQQ
jgi:hypothetical protein